MNFTKILLLFILCLSINFAKGQYCINSKLEYIPDTIKTINTINTHQVLISGCVCASPCGNITTYTVFPPSWAAESPHYVENPVIAANTTSPIQCFTFTANNTSENIDMGSVVTGFFCGFSKFNWTVYDASCVFVASGTIANLTVNGLTCGSNYTLCISFKNSCTVDSICPYVYNSNCASLPIELLNFDATYLSDENIVKIQWTTATETNNKFFTISKSTDGISWENVTIQPGAGNSVTKISYNTIDEDPSPGISYYRLKQTDYDGNFIYSDVVSVNITENYAVTVFPNPVSGNITLRYESQSTNPIEVEVYDLSGRAVIPNYSIENTTKGTGEYEIYTSGLSKGVYIMHVGDLQKTFYIKFAKN